MKYSTQKTGCNNDDSSKDNQQEGGVVQEEVNEDAEFGQTWRHKNGLNRKQSVCYIETEGIVSSQALD